MKSHNFSLFMNHNQISKMKDERWNFSKQFSWKKIYICCLQLVTFLYPRIKLLLTQSLTFYNEGNYNFKESVSNTGQSHIIFWSFSIFSTLRLSIEHTSYQPKTKAFAMEREREREREFFFMQNDEKIEPQVSIGRIFGPWTYLINWLFLRENFD